MEKEMNKKSDMTDTQAQDSVKTVKQLTVADKIWNDIKDERLEMFALPDQFVRMYCEPISIEPTKLYLKFTVAAVLPALEIALDGLYKVELVNKYICVSLLEKK